MGFIRGYLDLITLLLPVCRSSVWHGYDVVYGRKRANAGFFDRALYVWFCIAEGITGPFLQCCEYPVVETKSVLVYEPW
jgi:hypothetical protein